MKKIFLLTLAVAVIVMSGCKKNFEPKLLGSLSPANFPQTEADFESYTMEVYKPFQAKWQYMNGTQAEFAIHGYEFSIVQMFDAPTDIMEKFVDWGGFFTGFSTANFDFMKSMSRGKNHFEQIRFVTRITKIIGDLENAGAVSSANKNLWLGEAKMARGWLMYYLLHMYGPVPVILDPAKIGTEAEYDLTRPARANYVAAIASDLRFAADNLPQSPAVYGRFNKGLALTVLMRLYLNEKDWQKAESAGREIAAMGYSLVNNYKDLFRTATERNSETIFALSVDASADGGDAKGNMNAWTYYTLGDCPGITQKGGWAQAFSATWKFYDSFDTLDKRRKMFITSYTSLWDGKFKDRTNGLKGPVILKYPDEENTSFAHGNDIPLARYGDVMLMLAEAINNQNGPTAEAIGLVNDVRAKHGGIGGLVPADVASKDAFNDAILRERGYDLFMEGQRKMDLVRHGKWQSALQAVGKTPPPAASNFFFPIPQYALDASNGKLTQTPGY
ncbi:MAG: RagB/SusD family nutrient uptake outer membrane protein [Chitinophagaceae bacterium]